MEKLPIPSIDAETSTNCKRLYISTARTGHGVNTTSLPKTAPATGFQQNQLLCEKYIRFAAQSKLKLSVIKQRTVVLGFQTSNTVHARSCLPRSSSFLAGVYTLYILNPSPSTNCSSTAVMTAGFWEQHSSGHHTNHPLHLQSATRKQNVLLRRRNC